MRRHSLLEMVVKVLEMWVAQKALQSDLYAKKEMSLMSQAPDGARPTAGVVRPSGDTSAAHVGNSSAAAVQQEKAVAAAAASGKLDRAEAFEEYKETIGADISRGLKQSQGDYLFISV